MQIKWLESPCGKQMLVENKHTPESGCFEDKALSFVYPLSSRWGETTVSMHNLSQVEYDLPAGAVRPVPAGEPRNEGAVRVGRGAADAPNTPPGGPAAAAPPGGAAPPRWFPESPAPSFDSGHGAAGPWQR